VISPSKNFLTWAGSVIFGLGLGLENFPKKTQNFQFFALLAKKISSGQLKKSLAQRRPGQPVIYCGSKACFGWVRAHL